MNIIAETRNRVFNFTNLHDIVMKFSSFLGGKIWSFITHCLAITIWHRFISIPISIGETRVTTPTAIESQLPWKRDENDSETGAVQQNEFPAWASNKEYLAYNSPSATFLGKFLSINIKQGKLNEHMKIIQSINW